MNNKISRKLERLEKSRQKLLQQLMAVPSAQINKKPSEREWSLGQVIFHLYLVDRLTLDYMVDKAKKTESLAASGFKQQWRSLLLKVALLLPFKFKAPTSVKDSIPDEVNIDEVKKAWSATQSELEKFIDQLPETTYQLMIFRHPRIGMINLYQTLEFLQDHFDHHLPQINRLLSKYKAA